MIFSLMTMSVSFLAGQTGLVSLMTSVFFGISGYMVAILQIQYSFPFPIPPLVGLIAALLLAVLVSPIVLRTRGTYFLMLTLVIGLAVWALALQLSSITGGTTGIIGIKAPTFLGVSLHSSRAAFYYSEFILFALAVAVYIVTVRSRFGLALRGIRESESRMAMLGYPVLVLKASAFVISAGFAALSGISFVYFYGVISPDAIALTANVNPLIAAILGGTGNLAGIIVGSTVFKLLDSVLGSLTNRYLLISGGIFLLVMLFVPNGLAGAVRKRFSKVAKKQY
jgi:branched-chain amino acid transport system permease protein